MAQGVVALVPMRHHSERAPGKNYRPLGGVPLFHHIVRALLECPSVTQVVIDTDSDVIAGDVRRHFSQVRLLERPAHLCGDAVPMTDILWHDVEQVPAAWYLQTHSTNPFLRAETIERALQAWWEAQPVHDSLFTVTRLQARLWDHRGHPMNHDPAVLRQTQTLEPVYVENSSLYVFPASLIRSRRRRIGERPLLFELDPLEAIDLDEERDLAMAELLMQAKMSVAK